MCVQPEGYSTCINMHGQLEGAGINLCVDCEYSAAAAVITCLSYV